jgi:hypothetical protein
MLILWDVDDVLNQLMKEWLKSWHQQDGVGQSHLSFDQLTDNPPHKQIGISLEEYYRSLDEFRNSLTARDLIPNRQVLHWFNQHGKGHVHIALTARPVLTMPNQAAWIYDHFGQWIQSVVTVAPARKHVDRQQHGTFETKVAYAKWLGKPSVLIDDNQENIASVKGICPFALLFPQPWNASRQKADEVLSQLTEYLG